MSADFELCYNHESASSTQMQNNRLSTIHNNKSLTLKSKLHLLVPNRACDVITNDTCIQRQVLSFIFILCIGFAKFGSELLFHCVHSAFDLVNIHLFHDASNLVAWENSPSVYSDTRQKALGYVLDR